MLLWSSGWVFGKGFVILRSCVDVCGGSGWGPLGLLGSLPPLTLLFYRRCDSTIARRAQRLAQGSCNLPAAPFGHWAGPSCGGWTFVIVS